MIKNKFKGHIGVPQALIHSLFGKSKRPTTTFILEVNHLNETIQLTEHTKGIGANKQKSMMLTYEVVARKLGFPEEVRIDAVYVKVANPVLNEAPTLTFVVSSDKPVHNFTCIVGEGSFIPYIAIPYGKKEEE